MNKKISALLILLLCGNLLSAAGQYVEIGKCRWFTEQSSFPEIIEAAKKAGKPILAFYSATWCGPCQDARRNILSVPEFQEVEEEVVLVFIEQTQKKGAEYVEKHRIKFFPTIKMFSVQGEEMDSDSPGETVESVLEWIRWVKKRAIWLDRLAKNPIDWDALFRATYKREKLLESSDQYDTNMDLLRRALRTADKRDTANRHKAHELLIDYLYLTLLSKKGPRAMKYAVKYKKEFTRLMRAYYPDKFYYILKTKNPLAMWIDWLNRAGDYRGLLRVFEHSQPAKQKMIDIGEHMALLGNVITAYLALGYEDRAESWFKRIETSFNGELKNSILETPPFTYTGILQAFIEHGHKTGKLSIKRKYSEKLLDVLDITRAKADGKALCKAFPNFEDMIEFFQQLNMNREIVLASKIFKGMIDRFDDESCREIVIIRLAKKFGFFVDEALALIDEKKKVYGSTNTYLITTRAVLLARKGEKDKAVQLIAIEYEKIRNNATIDNTSRGRALNNLAWSLVEMDAANEKIGLEIAEQAVSCNRNNYNLDTLATIHAGHGHYREAIRLGREALKMAKWEKDQVEIEKKLERWQKQIK